MRRAFLPLLLAALATPACSTAREGCRPRAPGVHVPTTPPAPLPDLASDPPAPSMTRIAAYWHWDGERWVWVPGYWITPPEGQHWAPAYTTPARGHAVFYAGAMVCKDD